MAEDKGIISPWAKEKPKEEPKANFWEEMERLPGKGMNFTPIRFVGRAYSLYVVTPTFKNDNDTTARARIILGHFIQTLIKDYPRLKVLLDKQSIYFVEPSVSKITLELGPIKLYATASSQNFDLAQKMTIDRLVLALMELKGAYPKSKEIFKNFEIEVTNKA